MPLVTISVHEGQLDADQKTRMISLVTDAVVKGEGFGEVSRPSTWVEINEVPAGNFGVGGRVIRLEDLISLFKAGQNRSNDA